MRKIRLGNSDSYIDIIGQGTWGFDELYDENRYKILYESLNWGFEHGLSMVDTAERYGWGGAEYTIGKVIREKGIPRDSIFISSKVWGTNLSYDDLLKAADRSLKRMEIKCIDLYKIHWPNPFKSLSQTMKAMEELVKQGKIRYIGVSNFPLFYLKWAQHCLKREELVSNQIYFSLAETGPLKSMVPFAQKEHLTVIACSPLGGTKGNNLKKLPPQLFQIVTTIANNHHLTFHQIALAWLISQSNVQVIPKAAKISHKEACIAVGDIQLTTNEMNQINNALK